MSVKKIIFPIVVSALALCSVLITGNLSWGSVNNGSPVKKVFHNGGTGDCEGCHLMHNAEDEWGESDDEGSSTINAHRLKGSDPSSTCLKCHQDHGNNGLVEQCLVSTDPGQMASGLPPGHLTPGGDFGWLKKNYSWGNNERSVGDRHGHNIIAADFNYSAETVIVSAPGGAYPSSSLSCISCHDPHGNYRRTMDGTVSRSGTPVVASGSYTDSPDPDRQGAVSVYRMLAGKGYMPKNLPGARQFSADPPAAVAPVLYNRSEAATDTRVAYGSGMSEWCGNCHAGIHNDGNPGIRRHPAGNSAKLSAETVTNYNSYIASGNLNGNSGTAYTSMVPFEMGTSDYTILKMTANSTGSLRNGPTLEANVMCLTCHRAHASGWDSMTRWNMQSEFIVYNGRYPGVDNGAPERIAQGRTVAEVQKAFYDRPAKQYAYYQRSLCNKCHAKD